MDSVAEIWGPLINGLTILVVPKATVQDPEKLVNLLEEYEVITVERVSNYKIPYINTIKNCWVTNIVGVMLSIKVVY